MPIEAENEDQAQEKVEAVCNTEKSLEEVGLSGKTAEAIVQLADWVIDVYEDVCD